MVEVNQEQRKAIAPLFEKSTDTMVLSCLQGHMGRAWADCLPNPRSARILSGDFCFFGGKEDRELASRFAGDFSGDVLLAADPAPGWASLLREIYGNRCTVQTRYAIRKNTVFDRERLERFRSSLPEKYRLCRIDREIYPKLMAEGWSRDFCSNFQDGDDFLRRGTGYAILCGENPVSGASSYSVYDGGIEIEIDTRRDHRRKGLAQCCAAALILECLERGLYPSWDAANPVSVHLAQTLGYEFEREYPVYEISMTESGE